MSAFSSSSAAGGGGGGGASMSVGYINEKPHTPEEFTYYRSEMLETISKETRHVGIFLSLFQQIVIEEHVYIGFDAVEKIVEQFNHNYFDKGAMILLNVNGNKYTGDINIVEMKLVLMNGEKPDGMTEFITTIEGMFNDAATEANRYIKTQEEHKHETYKTEDVDCFVPIIADDYTQEIIRMSPIEYEVGTLYSGDDIVSFHKIDAKYNAVEGKKCFPKFLFYKSYQDPNNPGKNKLHKSCGYVFDNSGIQYQIFMFNYKSQTLPFVYLFDEIDKIYIAVKIQKNVEKQGPNAYTIFAYDGTKLFDMDLIPTTMTGDLSSVESSRASGESSLKSSAYSSVANSTQPSRQVSLDPRAKPIVSSGSSINFNDLSYKLQNVQTQQSTQMSWKKFNHAEEVMKLVYPKEYVDDDDEDDDEDDEEATEQEVIDAFKDLLQFSTMKTILLPTFPGCAFGCFARLNVLIVNPTTPVEFFKLLHHAYLEVPELVCRYIFSYGDLKNFYLNADFSEFDNEDVYELEQKENVLICLSQMNIMSKGVVDNFFIEYISKQKIDLLKGQPCYSMRIGNNYEDETINDTLVKTSTNYFNIQMETQMNDILIFVPTSLLTIISGSSKIEDPKDPNVGNALIAITNGEKKLTPPSLETVDELFKDSLFSLFRTPQGDLPCLFDIFGNMCNDINATFPGLAFAIIAGGGPFALLGTGKIADVDCMIIIRSIFLNLVKQFLIEKITDIMYFINANAQSYFPGPFEFYLNDEHTHFYRVVFKGCKVRIHGDEAKIKRLHSLDLVFDYYEIQGPTIIGKFEKSFAALDVVIKIFTGDNSGDIWDESTPDLPSFAAKYINVGDGNSVYPAWNISGMLLALISTLDPRTINPNMRELVGKLLNECKRPKFVLDLLIKEGANDENLNKLNDVLTELISGGTVTAAIMEEKQVFAMLLYIVQNISIENANQMFTDYIQPKLFISNTVNRTLMIAPQTLGFLPQQKKNDVAILSLGGEGAKGDAIVSIMGTDKADVSIMGDPQKYMSAGLSIDIGVTGEVALRALISTKGDYNSAKMLLKPQMTQPTVFGSFASPMGSGGSMSYANQHSTAVAPKSGGGRAETPPQLYFIKNDGTSKLANQTTKTGALDMRIYKKNLGNLVWIYENGETKPYGGMQGGARHTRHRANKPVKTRKHRNRGANRNTRRRRPRKTIRK